MVNPVFMILTGVVIAAAAIIAVLATNPPQMHSYDRRGPGDQHHNYPSPPSSPKAMSVRRRRRRTPSPRRSSSPEWRPERHCNKCGNCGESPYVKIYPCNHQSLCKSCFTNYLETRNTCPTCNGRIDNCLPIIPPFGKCKSCRNFTKLFKFLPCSHSPSLCFSCFEETGKVYKRCPECENLIQGYEPNASTSGLCIVCKGFTRFAVFKPCGHSGNFCQNCARLYLLSEEECIDCCTSVKRIA